MKYTLEFALQAEVIRLESEVARLRAVNASLLAACKAVFDRGYEDGDVYKQLRAAIAQGTE